VVIGRLPVDDQVDALRAALSRNEVLVEVLARAAKLDLPGWYLTAGCVFQTVWNVVAGRSPTAGIRDYDLFYFDVHLWYEDHFGVPCAPYTSTEVAIDSFAATTCCLGIRLGGDGRWRVYAPHGLSDVFNLVVRPQPSAGSPQRLRDQSSTLARTLAGAHRAALARTASQRNVTDFAAWPVRPE